MRVLPGFDKVGGKIKGPLPKNHAATLGPEKADLGNDDSGDGESESEREDYVRSEGGVSNTENTAAGAYPKRKKVASGDPKGFETGYGESLRDCRARMPVVLEDCAVGIDRHMRRIPVARRQR